MADLVVELEQVKRDFAGLALENLKLRANADKLAETLRWIGDAAALGKHADVLAERAREALAEYGKDAD
jgi:cell division protein FtsB